MRTKTQIAIAILVSSIVLPASGAPVPPWDDPNQPGEVRYWAYDFDDDTLPPTISVEHGNWDPGTDPIYTFSGSGKVVSLVGGRLGIFNAWASSFCDIRLDVPNEMNPGTKYVWFAFDYYSSLAAMPPLVTLGTDNVGYSVSPINETDRFRHIEGYASILPAPQDEWLNIRLQMEPGETKWIDNLHVGSHRPLWTHYVDSENTTPVAPYTNWTTAATSIQDAVDEAIAGETVLVANGTYATGGAEVHSMSNRVALTKAVTVRSVNGREHTTIVGSGPLGPSAVRCAYVTNGAALVGFTLTEGYTHTTGDSILERSGGGVFFDRGGVLSNCSISVNSADNKGGGVFFNKGGMLNRCAILGNVSDSTGGGVFCDYFGTLNECILLSNSANYGGGAYCWRGGIFKNCLFSENTAQSEGGGLFSAGSFTAAALDNCTLGNNTATLGGGVHSSAAASFRNCVVWDNPGGDWDASSATGTWSYCCTMPSVGEHSVTGDPDFVAADNYRLGPVSPCIDAGASLSWMAGATDLDGHTRIMGLGTDLGAYEALAKDPGASRIHYVSPSGTDEWPYTNWVTAARTIQPAIGAAGADDTVLVDDGIYDAGGTKVYGMDNRIVLTEAITVESMHGPEFTSIVGSGPLGPSAVRCAYVTNGAALVGFTLTEGYTHTTGDSILERSGGGVFFDRGGVLSNCSISVNSADNKGGGVFFNKGGMLNRCAILGNVSDSTGGGVFCDYFGTLNECILLSNSANYGGGAYCWRGGIFKNCLFSENTAQSEGGGLFSAGSFTAAALDNCTLGNNTATLGGGVRSSAAASFRNCVVWDNPGGNWDASSATGTWSYCCTMPSVGEHSVTGDPDFVAADNYRLGPVSPCIDAGASLSWMVGATDLDGYTRIMGPAVDIGAYEGMVEHAGESPFHYVSTNGAAIWPYTNWTTAARTIQDAVDAAGSHDTVLVTNGTYLLSSTIGITQNLLLESVHGPAATLIDGQGSVRCLDLGSNACVISGFTIQNGYAGHWDGLWDSGGGVYCFGTVPVVTNCTINSNTVEFGDGGGMYGGTANHCTIIGNKSRSGEGGGMYGGEANHCTIISNVATIGVGGGGMYGGTANHCTISGNTGGNGGGMYGGTANHCTISGNTGENGGGMYFGTASNSTIIGNTTTFGEGGGMYGGAAHNCTIISNAANGLGGGGGMYRGTAYNCTIIGNVVTIGFGGGGGMYEGTATNCIVWYNTVSGFGSNNIDPPTAYHSCSPDLTHGTSGNITHAPVFIDRDGGNYRLAVASPCIDAGTNLPWMVGATDLDGNPRIVHGVVDMGAHEHPDPVAAPVVVTLPASELLNDSGTLNGSVNPTRVSTDAWFEWGPSATYGQRTSPEGAGSGSSPVAVAAALSNLAPGVTYHFRCVASNGVGVTYGADQTFWIPVLTLTGGDTITNAWQEPFVDPGAIVSASPLAVAGGVDFSLALKADGTIVGWGSNSHGQLAIPTEATNVMAIAAGNAHGLGIRANGTALAWGSNNAGQSPVPAVAHSAAGISAGSAHNLVLRSDGTVVGWGRDFHGQATGVPNTTSPYTSTGVVALAGQILTNVAAVAAGWSHSLAALTDGTTVGWGFDSYGQASVSPDATNVVAVAAGHFHSLALRSDRTVVGWGLDGLGQVSGPAGETNAVAIAAGDDFSLVLRADGTVVGWGINVSFQLDVPARATNVVAIAAGLRHSLALTAGGTVIAWGWNDDGQADVPSDLSTLDLPVTVGGSLDVDSPGEYTLTYSVTNALGAAATATRTVVVQAPPVAETLPATNMLDDQATLNGAAHPLYAPTTAWFEWGPSSVYGQSTEPLSAGSGSTPTAVAAALSNLTPGVTYHFRCVASNSLGVAYGEDQSFWTPALTLTGGDTITNAWQIPFVDPGVAANAAPLAIAAGDAHSLALKADGIAVGWGMDSSGQTNVPVGVTNAVDVAAGGWHSLALSADHGVTAWGLNNYGQTHVPGAATGAVAIAAGDHFSLALKSDGTVLGWGSSISGQTNVPAGASGVVAIAAGGWHGLALKADGTVVGWGDNSSGQTNAPFAATNVVAVAAGGAHSLALRGDGTIVGWGNNGSGQTDIPSEATNVVAIAAGGAHSLALRADGTVVGWGNNGSGQADIPSKATNVVAIAAGGAHSLALQADGTILGWGSNAHGQTSVPFGLGTLNLPVAVSGTVDEATLGAYELTYSTTNALGAVATATRTVLVMGQPEANTLPASGMLNDEATLNGTVNPGGYPATAWFEWGSSPVYEHSTVPVSIGDGLETVAAAAQLSNLTSGVVYHYRCAASNSQGVTYGEDQSFWTPALVFDGPNTITHAWNTPFHEPRTTVSASPLAIAAGVKHALALRADGTVEGWGLNFYGEVDVPPFATNVVAIGAGSHYSMVLRADGMVAGWGWNDDGQTDVPPQVTNVVAICAGPSHCLALRADGTVVGWGDNSEGQTNVPVQATNVLAMAAGVDLSLALLADGTVVGWGSDDYGQATIPPSATNVAAIASGWRHSLALRADGTVVGWGENYRGQAAIPDCATNIVAIAGGGEHSLALRADGTVLGWGHNCYGQATGVPNTDSPYISTGTVVLAGQTLSNVVAIAANNDYSLALRADGSVVGWGDSPYGQTAIPAGNMLAEAVAAGSSHSLLLRANGTLFGWGYNGYEPLDIPSNATDLVAIEAGHASCLGLRSDGSVLGWGYNFYGAMNVPEEATNVVLISEGYLHCLAMRSNGSVLGWGYNGSGQTDVPVGTTNAVALSTGYEHSLALRADGTVLGWGGNARGQTTIPGGATSVVAIAAGGSHSLALRADGTVVSWGDNDFGQTDVPAGATNVVALSAGTSHSLALRADGTVMGWGGNDYGQTDVPTDATNVVSIAAGWEHNLARRADGSVVGWGRNFYGQANVPLGVDVLDLPVAVTGAVDVQTPGVYELMYSVTNALGAVATAARTVVVQALPAVGTLPPSDMLNGEATLNGSVNPGLSPTMTWFEWGPSSACGQSTEPLSAGNGSSPVAMAAVLSNLTPGVTYHYRCVASNRVGVTYGVDQTFWIPALAINGPDAITNAWQVSFVDPGATVSARPVAIDGGYKHSLALKADGTIVAWGDDAEGQCTMPTGATNMVAVAGGYLHSLGLRSDGTVLGWGRNNAGETTIPAEATNATAIAAGIYHGLALCPGGSVLGWGSDGYGQVSGASNATDLVALDAMGFHNLALRADGSVVGWGRNDDGQVTIPPEVTNAVAIAAGGYHGLALQADGTVVGWGTDSFGQLPVPAHATNVVAIAAGNRHSLALKTGGIVTGWGTYDDEDIPPGVTDVVAIAAGSNHSLALRADGWVFAWGWNNDAQCDVPADLTTLDLPVTVSGFVDEHTPGRYEMTYSVTNTLGAVATASRTVVVLDPMQVDTLSASNLSAAGPDVGATLNGTVDPNGMPADAWFVWGSTHAFENATMPVHVGDGSIPVAVDAGLSNLTAGVICRYRCAASNGVGVTYGEEQTFWIPALSLAGGDSVTNELHVPFVDPLGVTHASPLAIAAGWSHSLALKADGTVAAWGTNSYGQVTVPSAATGVVAVAAGHNHNLAVRAGGTIVGWGDDREGQATIPAGATAAVAAAGGQEHSVALRSDGSVISWGDPGSGRTATPDGATNVGQVTAGGAHNLALRADGTIVGWGWNGHGQTTVPGHVTAPVEVSAGRYHSLALLEDGTVVGWGHNVYGQTNVPAHVSNAVAVAAGGYHNLALLADGTVAGWGRNSDGQTNVPDHVTNVVAIAAGGAHSLALLADGTVVGWGNSADGRTSAPGDLLELSLPITVSGTVEEDTPGLYELTYSVTNDLGAVATATRTVVVLSTAVEPVILGEAQLGSSAGVFTFSVEGEEGQVVVIEATTNLPSAGAWDPIQTNALGSGPLIVTDPESAGQQQKSYRAVSP